MPFLFILCLLKCFGIRPDNSKLLNSCGKEESFAVGNESHIMLSCVEKASVSASKAWKSRKRGSITLECAYCIPLFLLAAVCLIWTLEIRTTGLAIRCGMQEAGKQTAQEMYLSPVFSSSRLESLIVESIGADRLEQSLVLGGSGGIDCGGSYMRPGSRILELKASYKIRLPIPLFAVPSVEYEETMRIKSWTGYEKEGLGGLESEETVYLTETGTVYHRNPHCTYLEPSIRMVSAAELEGLRNESEAKYYACERCGGGHSDLVYITDYGTRYHGSLQCSGLKRTIYTVPLSEAKGRRPCGKCGK